MCDCEKSDVSRVKVCRARKSHSCCECGKAIRRGDNYENVTGIWEGSWLTFKTCEACVEVREDYAGNLSRYDCRPCFTQLWDDIQQGGHAVVIYYLGLVAVL